MPRKESSSLWTNQPDFQRVLQRAGASPGGVTMDNDVASEGQSGTVTHKGGIRVWTGGTQRNAMGRRRWKPHASTHHMFTCAWGKDQKGLGRWRALSSSLQQAGHLTSAITCHRKDCQALDQASQGSSGVPILGGV